MAKKFSIPFANSGDKTAVPNGVQPDGSVSYTTGFGPDYELDKALDPVNAKDVPRDQTNQLFYDLTDAVGEIQKFGYALWSTDLSPYALNAEVFHNGILWRSTSASNSGEPGVATTWTPDSPGATSVTMTNANVTLTAQQAARSVIIITGTLAANLQLIFPTYVKQWQVINNTTGNFSITCKTAAGGGVVISRIATIVGDGTNIVSVNNNLFIPGVIGESRNAVMQIAPSASATGTFTADSVIVGESVSGQVYRVTGISESINLATTGAGGMDTGLAPVSGYVALYLIYNPATLAVDLLARDATSVAAPEIYGGANMPAGYTASALVGVIPTNASRQFVVSQLSDRTVDIGNVAVLGGSTVQRSTPFSQSIAAAVPPNARSCSGLMNVGSSATASSAINVGGSDLVGQQGVGLNHTGAAAVTGSFANVPIRASSPQTILYTATVSAGTMSASIFINRYTF